MPARIAGPLLQVATWLASVERAATERGAGAFGDAEDTLRAAMDGAAVGLAGRALAGAVDDGELPYPPLAELLEAVRMSHDPRPAVTIDDLLDFGYRAMGSVGWLVAHMAGAGSAEQLRGAREAFTALYLLEQSAVAELEAQARARARELLALGEPALWAVDGELATAFGELLGRAESRQ